MTRTYVPRHPQTGAFDPSNCAHGFVMGEVSSGGSRSVVTLGPLPQDLQPGTVLGRITAGGTIVPLDLAATDGSEIAAAVALHVAGRDGTRDPLCPMPLVIEALTGNAEIWGGGLAWPAGITPNQVTAAVAQLRAVGLLVS